MLTIAIILYIRRYIKRRRLRMEKVQLAVYSATQ